MGRIGRRQFLIGTGAFVAAPLGVLAQQVRKIPRIGVLTGAVAENAPNAEAFRQRLRELGYVEGRNIAIEWRWAGGDLSRLPGLVQELVNLEVDLIVANSNAPIRAAQRATKTIPIVMVYPGDAVALGFVASLGRPGGNITGLTAQAPDLDGKRLQLLKEVVPGLSRVAVLWDSNQPGGQQRIKDMEPAALTLGLQPQFVEAKSLGEFEGAFAAMTKENAGAVVYSLSPMQFAHRARIAEHALTNRLPTFCAAREYVEAGCLMAYSPSRNDLWRGAANYVDRILKGAKPGDLPIEQPTKFELVINLKTAKALRITIPQSLLLRADEVIQ